MVRSDNHNPRRDETIPASSKLMETYEKLLLTACGIEAVVFKLQLRFEGEEVGETTELEGTTLGVVLDGKMAVVDGMACVFDLFTRLTTDGTVTLAKDILAVVTAVLL